MAGEAVRLLDGFGRRYAVAVRVATLPPIGAVALLQASAGKLAVTALTVAVAVIWTCAQGWLWRTTTVPVALDVAVLLGLCLSSCWTGGVQDGNTAWLRLLITFACVTWQWYTAPLPGIIAALGTGGSMLVIFDMAGQSPTSSLMWVLVMAVMSRAAWTVVVRAAERADRMGAEAEQARREAAVVAAVRAEERELANSLHDTAATTLLMVGTGQVPAGASWLAPQARRDLARLRSSAGGRRPDQADLVDLLRVGLDAGHLIVELDAPRTLPLPFDVAGAISGAVGEVLNNVRRHAGTDRARIRLHGDPSALRVEISDDGKGFAVTEGASTARRGLRESVHGRMERVGGTATIISAEGVGTMVRLEWRSDE
ncbi:sensor histidine kinase [Lentzea aerocolonigenes]|uniref:sensor histidine kinase n=1 Tax=Lentzea aerocolonigenes TaxID=68170 RepID=UPI0006973053|nr:ATP-binding protein [Lentzea aerocolonigenes]